MVDKEYLLEFARLTLRDIETKFIQLGRALWDIRNHGAWDLGYESFDNPAKHNFVEDIGLSKPLANKLINVTLKFGHISSEKLLQAGQTRLFECLPYVDRETPEKLVEIAASFPNKEELRKGLKHEYGEPKPPCTHEDSYTLIVCRGCGQRTVPSPVVVEPATSVTADAANS